LIFKPYSLDCDAIPARVAAGNAADAITKKSK
jgi:hypothetical protein